LFARRRPMGRGRSHIAPFPAGPQPVGPTVIGHLAPVKTMGSHREWIQAPVLASWAAEAAVTSCTPAMGRCFALNRLVDRFGLPQWLAVLADTLSEADFRSPSYWKFARKLGDQRPGITVSQHRRHRLLWISIAQCYRTPPNRSGHTTLLCPGFPSM
jgi:hypothetical protein